MRMLSFPDGRVKVLLQGLSRARIEEIQQEYPHFEAEVRVTPDLTADATPLSVEALMRTVRRSLEKLITQGRGINPEVVGVAAGLDDAGQLADLVASNLNLGHEEVQEILEILDPLSRLRRVAKLANHERTEWWCVMVPPFAISASLQAVLMASH